ncbi:hypothetical protein MKL09_27090 [Methylobacterium sp. J-048]|uniref:hypothetical protein n=1 Tax=Methylobacterium sp. J-048 TaxID=2836635 RepID=UPI001FBA8777|nr:hypothetical protein [Methylobacterium sp. J-048]MCJ2060182.1 hypothetical protein [Methylobacterium sp. J-048]
MGDKSARVDAPRPDLAEGCLFGFWQSAARSRNGGLLLLSALRLQNGGVTQQELGNATKHVLHPLKRQRYKRADRPTKRTSPTEMSQKGLQQGSKRHDAGARLTQRSHAAMAIVPVLNNARTAQLNPADQQPRSSIILIGSRHREHSGASF